MNSEHPLEDAAPSPTELIEINRICDRLEADWRAGGRPLIEDRLAGLREPIRSALLKELLASELEFRFAAGERGLLSEYRARFTGDTTIIEAAFAIRDEPTRPVALPVESCPGYPAALEGLPAHTPSALDASGEPKKAEARFLENTATPRDRDPELESAVTVAPSGPTQIQDGDPFFFGAAGARKLPAVVVRHFGDYELLHELARGGMGVVYKARQISLNRTVALKMILSGQLATDAEVRRFYQEAEAAAGLDHPGIVPIFEVGEHDGHHFYSMSYVEGRSLSQRMAAGPLPAQPAADLVRQVAEAVEYAHRRGVIHRDLKPGNVLVDAQNCPRVTDFGLAKKLDTDSSLTVTGSVMGTPSYMPPEQAAGRVAEVGPASDVYSLGALLYCLLTGRPPFQASTPVETLRQVIEDDPVPPRTLNGDTPRDLQTIVLKCLHKERQRRYRSAEALAIDLGRWLRGEPIEARPVGSAERLGRWCLRNPVVAGLIASMVFLLVAVAVGSSLAAYQYLLLAERQERTARAETNARGRADALAAQERETAAAERHARTEADRLKGIAEAKSAESRQRLVAHLVAEGVKPLEEGDLLSALPWFAEAQSADAGHTERQQLLRLASTLQQSPRLVRAHFMQSSTDSLDFDPAGKTVVSTGPGTVAIFDLSSGRPRAVTVPVDANSSNFIASADGRFVSWVVARRDEKKAFSEVHVWDVNGGRRVGPPARLDGAVDQVQISAGGQRVSLLNDGRSIRILDPSTGRDAAPSITIGKPVGRTELSGDGRRLVIDFLKFIGLDIQYFTQVWDAETGRSVSPPLRHPSQLLVSELSPDGTKLLTVNSMMPNAQGAARVWDLTQGTIAAGPFDHGETGDGYVVHATLGPDGNVRATAGANDARIWDLSRKRLAGRPLVHGGPVSRVAFSPDGQRLATLGGREGTARVWNVITREPVLPPLHQAIAIGKLRFSHDGRLLLTLGRDDRSKAAEVRGWDLTRAGDWAGTEQRFSGRVMWHEPRDRCVVVASGSTDRTYELPTPPVAAIELQILDRKGGQPVAPALKLDIKVRSALLATSLSSDGRRLVAAVGPTQFFLPSDLFLWDVPSGRRLAGPLAAPGPVAFVVLTPDGQRAAVLLRADPRARVTYGDQRYYADRVWLWDIERGRGQLLPTVTGRSVLFAAFSPDGRRLVTVQPGRAQLWDAAVARAIGPGVAEPVSDIAALGLSNAVWSRRALLPCAAFDPAGRLLAVSVGASPVHRIDPETGMASRPTLVVDDDVSLLRFSGDGRRLIVARFAGEQASVWNANDATSIGRPRLLSPRRAAGSALPIPNRGIEEIDIDSEGRVALTAHADGVRLWDVDSGVPLSPPLPFADAIARAWFDGDDRLSMVTRDATMSRDGRRIWTRDLGFGGRPGAELRRAAGILSGRRVDDVRGPVRVDSGMLGSDWSDLRGKSASLLNEPGESLEAWHRRRAADSEMAGLAFAARVHLDGLIAAAPDDPDPGLPPIRVYSRRGEVLAELGEWDRAAADFAKVLMGSPVYPGARESLAVVQAFRGDHAAYRAACAPLLPSFQGARASVSSAEMEMVTLMPGALGNPEVIVNAAEQAMAASREGDPAPQAARGRAYYRAGRYGAAAQDLRASLATYARMTPSHLAARPARDGPPAPSAASGSAGATLDGDEGTPSDWLFLAMAEQRLNHTEEARRRFDQATRWIDQARRDPRHPSVLGAFSDPTSRQIARMTVGIRVLPEFVPTMRGKSDVLTQYMPTWRQMLILEILRREGASLMIPRAATELPANVFAR
jgi:WD40 repeat protein/tRNA A-37 threonylcarbamoyl transferase component Bud32/tetratricopeptide (TPR) repeat protein